MESKEFIGRARDLGYAEEQIQEILREQREAREAGVTPLPLESMLVELPDDETTQP